MMQSELISQDNEEQEQTLQPVDFQAQLKKPSSERPHPPVPTAATAYAALIEKANLDVYPTGRTGYRYWPRSQQPDQTKRPSGITSACSNQIAGRPPGADRST